MIFQRKAILTSINAVAEFEINETAKGASVRIDLHFAEPDGAFNKQATSAVSKFYDKSLAEYRQCKNGEAVQINFRSGKITRPHVKEDADIPF